MRLIDADELKTKVLKEGTKYILTMIDNAPTVDGFSEIDALNNQIDDLSENLAWYINERNRLLKEKRPHGKWIKQEWGYSCSVCGVSNDYAYDNNIHKFTDYYCPNCGAKMDGGEE